MFQRTNSHQVEVIPSAAAILWGYLQKPDCKLFLLFGFSRCSQFMDNLDLSVEIYLVEFPKILNQT